MHSSTYWRSQAVTCWVGEMVPMRGTIPLLLDFNSAIEGSLRNGTETLWSSTKFVHGRENHLQPRQHKRRKNMGKGQDQHFVCRTSPCLQQFTNQEGCKLNQQTQWIALPQWHLLTSSELMKLRQPLPSCSKELQNCPGLQKGSLCPHTAVLLGNAGNGCGFAEIPG